MTPATALLALTCEVGACAGRVKPLGVASPRT
jgi:hypothetical protein